MMRYLSLNEYRSRFTELKKQDLYKMSISESSRFISNEMMENVDSWNRYWIIKKEDFVNQIDAQIFPSRSERMLIELDGIMFYVLKIHNERVKYYPENDRHKHETYSFIQDKFNQAYLGFQIESPYDR